MTSMVVLAVVVAMVIRSEISVSVSAEGYLPPTEASSVIVRLRTGSGDVVVDASARETVDQVQVMLKIRSPRGARTAVGIPVEVTIPLQQQLGGRIVIDGRTGNALPQVEREP